MRDTEQQELLEVADFGERRRLCDVCREEREQTHGILNLVTELWRRGPGQRRRTTGKAAVGSGAGSRWAWEPERCAVASVRNLRQWDPLWRDLILV